MSGIIHNIRLVVMSLLLALICLPKAQADGGWACLQEIKEPYRVTVFADSAPLRAGPVDFTVLVQDFKTNEPVLDAEVVLSLVPDFLMETSKEGQWLPPCCRLAANTLENKTVLGAGGNGLLYESRTSLNQPGGWKINVSITRKSQTVLIDGKIQVENGYPPWSVYWPYLLLPLLGLVFMLLNWGARQSRRAGNRLAGAQVI